MKKKEVTYFLFWLTDEFKKCHPKMPHYGMKAT